MRPRITICGVCCVMALVAAVSTASAQPSDELWGDFTVDWLQTSRLTWELEIEPQLPVHVPAGKASSSTLNVTPSMAYAASKWFDATVEFLGGYTDQSEGDDVFEATARFGLHLQILSRLLADRAARSGAEREPTPLRRLVFSTWVRMEYRNQFHSNDTATTTTWRLRSRPELAYPFNRNKITADGAVYATGDAELFFPFGDAGGFVNQYRIRAGFGYRRSFRWRLEALAVQTRSRKTQDAAFSTASNAFDIRVKMVF
jgi:hypothetical protein